MSLLISINVLIRSFLYLLLIDFYLLRWCQILSQKARTSPSPLNFFGAYKMNCECFLAYIIFLCQSFVKTYLFLLIGIGVSKTDSVFRSYFLNSVGITFNASVFLSTLMFQQNSWCPLGNWLLFQRFCFIRNYIIIKTNYKIFGDSPSFYLFKLNLFVTVPNDNIAFHIHSVLLYINN